MPSDTQKPFFKIYIVESPSEEDLKKGRSESKLLSEAMRLVGVRSEIKTVSTRAELEKALDPLIADPAR